ncbi:unnamed protein product [Brachionus calyciflorus]|uniref:Uncharacterized protein n=1 Tax=Brachionus calyciflorus TaxID=104777 RepID=A0A814DUL1_9BILA|nr:unnamed protein product [Brachionus calyciflorus]
MNKNIFIILTILVLLLIFVLKLYKDRNNLILPAINYPSSTNYKYNIYDDPNELVLKYVNLPYDYGYGSNSIPLAVSALLTKGPILELGTGRFSTPLFHKISSDYDRFLISVDTDPKWVQQFVFYNLTKNHRIYHISDYPSMDRIPGQENTKWGLVLVDHTDGNFRHPRAKNYAQSSEIVIVHDAEKQVENFYKYEENKLRQNFKYACKFSVFTSAQKNSYISTLIMSNYIDLSVMEEIFNKIKTDFGHVSCDLSY